jgi:hypothetical protein
VDATQDDVRKLLRTFGIQADAAIQARAREAQGVPKLRLRIVVEDLTDYGGGAQPAQPPRLVEVEGEVSAGL